MFKKKVITILLSTFMIISSSALSKMPVKAAGINGWRQNGTAWNYYINGSKATNWILSNGKWYYLNSSGTMQTGWILYNNKWYYLNSDGDMATGWIGYKGKQYYLNINGDMAVSTTTPDGYNVDNNGAWIPKAVEITIPTSAVSKIYFPSPNLTKTGANTATFQYRILDKAGIDITKSIPASQLLTSTSVIGTITLDPSIGIGTVTYKSASDVSTSSTITICDSISGIVGMNTEAAASPAPDTTVNGNPDVYTNHKVDKISITGSALSCIDSDEGPVGYAIYTVYNQYGSDITCVSSVDSNLTFKSKLGTVTGKNGLLTVRYLKGVDLTQIGTEIITITDTTTGVSTSATLTIVDKSK